MSGYLEMSTISRLQFEVEAVENVARKMYDNGFNEQDLVILTMLAQELNSERIAISKQSPRKTKDKEPSIQIPEELVRRVNGLVKIVHCTRYYGPRGSESDADQFKTSSKVFRKSVEKYLTNENGEKYGLLFKDRIFHLTDSYPEVEKSVRDYVSEKYGSDILDKNFSDVDDDIYRDTVSYTCNALNSARMAKASALSE